MRDKEKVWLLLASRQSVARTSLDRAEAPRTKDITKGRWAVVQIIARGIVSMSSVNIREVAYLK